MNVVLAYLPRMRMATAVAAEVAAPDFTVGRAAGLVFGRWEVIWRGGRAGRSSLSS